MEHYISQDFRNHPVKNLRLEHFSTNPGSPLSARLWYNSSDQVAYIQSGSLVLPITAKDDNFHNAPEIASNNSSDELLVWNSIATPSAQFDRYRRISFANFAAQFTAGSNSFSSATANSGSPINASGPTTLSLHGGHAYLQTRAVPAENRIYIEFQPQSQKTFFAGPSSGSSATPSFRSILKSDLPAGLGTVFSVGMNVPTGFDISGSPITESGVFSLSFSLGYSLPTIASQSNWDTAYGWGDHAGLYALLAHNHSGVYEPVLGNPLVDGHVLSSTILGARSWVPFPTPVNYWQRNGTVLSPSTIGDILAISQITEEVLNDGILIDSLLTVNTGSAPAQSSFYTGMIINVGQGISPINDILLMSQNYTALYIESVSDSLLLMSSPLGKIGFFGATPTVQSANWNADNVSATKTYNSASTSINELSNVLGSLIEELIAKGLIGAVTP